MSSASGDLINLNDSVAVSRMLCLLRNNIACRAATSGDHMMLLRIALLAVSSVALCTNAVAAPAKENGAYVGGTLGLAELDDDGAFNGLDFDDSDNAIIAHAGYKFIPYFAVEARVGDLGSYTVSGFGLSDTISIDVVSVHAVGIVPFGASGWEFFGQLGLGSADINCDGCSDETVGSAGIGVRYFPKPNLGISIQVDAWAYEDDSLGSQEFDVGVAATQVGISYLF